MERGLSPLRTVFEALDQDSDGYVLVDDVIQFARFYGGEKTKELTQLLDPSGLGVITFEDFYHGIVSSDTSELRLSADTSLPTVEEFEEYATFETEGTDSAYLGSESACSQCEAFGEVESSPQSPALLRLSGTDSNSDGAMHGSMKPLSSRFSASSLISCKSHLTLCSSGEEHFEDLGQGLDSERQFEGEEGSYLHSPNRFSILLSSPSEPVNSQSLLSASQHPLLMKELLGFCGHCHRRRGPLKDFSTRLTFLEVNGDSLADTLQEALEQDDTDMTDRMQLLEKRLCELKRDAAAGRELQLWLKQDNLQLAQRANMLEEQLKEQEAQAEELLQLERRRQKQEAWRLEREQSLELDSLLSRVQQLEEENGGLRSCMPFLKAGIHRLEEEKRKLLDELQTATERLKEEADVCRNLSDRLSHDREASVSEKESTQELIEELRSQLEQLQLYRLETETRSGFGATTVGLQEYQSRSREAELEQELRTLRQENYNLKEQNDDLYGQIINLSIQGARNLCAASSESLAAEISSASWDELLEAVQRYEDVNHRLQDYIDRIIVAVLESNPSLLEIK